MESLQQFGGMTVAIVLFIIGIVGIVVPLLPGILLIWGGILFYALAVDDFTAISPWLFVLITIIGIAAGTADLWLSLFGAKRTGASWKTLLLGLVGAIVGTFVLPMPLLGTIVGYAAGVLLGEFVRLRDWRAAFRAGIGGVVGWGVGTALQLVGGLLMIALFIIAVN